jgi:hypothetical protein
MKNPFLIRIARIHNRRNPYESIEQRMGQVMFSPTWSAEDKEKKFQALEAEAAELDKRIAAKTI